MQRNSQFYVAVRLLQLKEPTVTVLSHNKKDRALNLSNDQWDLAEDLVSVLRDLELVTTRLSSELYYPALSLLLPLMSGLQKTREPTTSQ